MGQHRSRSPLKQSKGRMTYDDFDKTYDDMMTDTGSTIMDSNRTRSTTASSRAQPRRGSPASQSRNRSASSAYDGDGSTLDGTSPSCSLASSRAPRTQPGRGSPTRRTESTASAYDCDGST